MNDIDVLKAIYQVNGNHQARALYQSKLSDPYTIASRVFGPTETNDSIDAVNRLRKSGYITCFAEVTEAGAQIVKKTFGELRHIHGHQWVSTGGTVLKGGFETADCVERRKAELQANRKVAPRAKNNKMSVGRGI